MVISLALSTTLLAKNEEEPSIQGRVSSSQNDIGKYGLKKKEKDAFSNSFVISPNIILKRNTEIAELENLIDDFDEVILDAWITARRDCLSGFQRIDLKYKNYLSLHANRKPVIIPIVRQNNKTFDLEYSLRYRYQFDTEKKVLLVTYTKGRQEVLYLCSENDVPIIYQDIYTTYLINQNFLAEHSQGPRIVIDDGAKFLDKDCRLAFLEKKYKKARSVCDLAAASSKSGIAHHYLGMLYRFEWGGALDYKTSFKHTLKAVGVGYSDSYSWLAWHYNFGKGVAKDFEKALKWRIASVDAGNLEGAYVLAKYYIKGEAVKQDFKEAIKWLEIAAEAGNSNAQNKIGCMYANGVGVKQDYKKAYHWIRESKYQNNPKAVYNLAVLYERNLIFKDGSFQAKRLYDLARKKGITKSTDIIDKYDRIWPAVAR